MAVNLESGTDLANIRDYVGDDAPTNAELAVLAVGMTYWQEVALRVLRRRRAEAASGEATTSFALSGVLSVGQKAADLDTLSDAIRDLEAQLSALTGDQLGGVSVTRIVRPDRRR